MSGGDWRKVGLGKERWVEGGEVGSGRRRREAERGVTGRGRGSLRPACGASPGRSA